MRQATELDHQSHDPLKKVYIGGDWHDGDGLRKVPLYDPDTEIWTRDLMCCAASRIDQAVNAANRALPNWSALSIGVRRSFLEPMISRIFDRQDEFAKTISSEIGAPIDFCLRAQVSEALNHLRVTRDALDYCMNDRPLSDDPVHRIRYEPIGVAALITPWNWPLNQIVLKVAAALMAGCTTVLKPSENATRTALLFSEVMAELNLPPGVFNLLIGDGETGAELVAHENVDIVSFTGSAHAGRHVAATAGRRLARTTLELGGKSPNILFEDCELEAAMQKGLAHCFRNSGQCCNAASRMLVARPIYEAAVATAARLTKQATLGRPHEGGTHLGPVVNRTQYERVQDFIQEGVRSDARLVAGGLGRPSNLGNGFYVCPTVFADVSPENPLFQKEIFGPVLTMTPFEGEAEAIELANRSDYGLAAYIQTGCEKRADRVARRLQVGMVQVNGTSRAAGAPFGGRKASGQEREAGIWGIRSFQDIKSISGCSDYSL